MSHSSILVQRSATQFLLERSWKEFKNKGPTPCLSHRAVLCQIANLGWNMAMQDPTLAATLAACFARDHHLLYSAQTVLLVLEVPLGRFSKKPGSA